MPRRPRLIYPGHVYHLIARFVAKEWFIRSDTERKTYLQLLGMSLLETDWRCFSFAVMSNHIHLAVVAGTSTLASWIGQAHSVFGEWINGRRDRIGAVFTRGPSSLSVSRDGAGSLMAYIHRNPVRAGVVSHADDSDWTSHGVYTGRSRRPEWLDVDTALRLTGFSNPASLARWLTAAAVDRAELARFQESPRAGRPSVATSIGITRHGDRS